MLQNERSPLPSSPLLLAVWVTSPPPLFLRLLLLLLSRLSDSPAPSAPRVFCFFLYIYLNACWLSVPGDKYTDVDLDVSAPEGVQLLFFSLPTCFCLIPQSCRICATFPLSRFPLSAGNILTRSAAPINSPPQ